MSRSLPLEPSTPHGPQALLSGQAEPNRLPEKRTVLVVDDTPANLQLVNSALKDLYRVRVATSGPKALELLAAPPPPDLILLDVMMPDMDGFEVCRRLKADAATAEIPVIFLTSKTDAQDETRGFACGAVDYIHKPFSPAVVGARVHTHLSLRESREQLVREKRRVDQLLDNLLPPIAVAEIKANDRVEPRQFDNVAVLFCDLVGFTDFCRQSSPAAVVDTLEALFTVFESCARRHQLEKIKTVGDSFLATAGLLQPVSDPLRAAAACALEIAQAVETIGWQVHSGLHQGPVVAGVVGQERFQFDIWGDTVNTAARLCSVARGGCVAVFEDLACRLPGATLTARGEVELKGKGWMRVTDISALEASSGR